jgi:hypothetical protein
MKRSGKPFIEPTNEIELRPDGWERFRGAVHAAAKSGPKHRPKKSASQQLVVEDKGKG